MNEWLKLLIAALVGITFLGLAGSSASGGTVDLRRLQRLFEKAPPADKAEVEKALVAMSASDYGGAISSLNKVAGKPNLTSKQKNAVQNTLTVLKQIQTEAAERAIPGLQRSSCH